MDLPTDRARLLEQIAGRLRPRCRSTDELATAAIREAILKAIFEPGEHLRLYEIAEQLGVTRMPVRAAIAQLESEGLVVFHPHRGSVVAELDSRKVRELYDIRLQLEMLAVEKAVRSITPEQLDRMEELEARFGRESDGDALVDLREELYATLYARVDNLRLIEHIERLRTGVGHYLLRLNLTRPDKWQRHGRLIELVRDGDVAGAQAYLGAHLVAVRDRLIDQIEQQSTR